MPFHADVYALAGQKLTASAPAGPVGYTVTYNGNASTGGSVPADPRLYSSGASVTVLSAGNLIDTGSTFGFWNTAADGSGISYLAGTTVTINTNMTLYAVWLSNTLLSGLTIVGTTLTGTYTGPAVVVIPAGITDFGTVFENNTTITSVTLPSSVTAIGANAFYKASALVSVTIPSSVTSIGFQAFTNDLALTNAVLPSTMTTIGNVAFSASGVKNVVIPASVTSIINNAYAYSNLGTMTIWSTLDPTTLFGGSQAIETPFGYGSSQPFTLSVSTALVSAYQAYFVGANPVPTITAIPGS